MTDAADTPVLIYATFPDMDSAKNAAADLVERRLAACVNLLPGMVSIYRWQGNIAQDAEIVAIVKSRKGLVDAVTGAICEGHPYDVPAVVALPICGGSEPFCDWIVVESSVDGA